MKTSNTWNYRSIVGKIMMLVLAAMVGNMNAAPALARGGHEHGGGHDNGRYEHNGRWQDNDRYEHRGRWHDNDRYRHRGHAYGHDRYDHDRRVYPPYGYRERVYAPPHVYAPPSPPGISIFVPPIIIHP